jgi:hypothetical protein
MGTAAHVSKAFMPVARKCLDTLYELNSQLALKVVNPHRDVSKTIVFQIRGTVGEAADAAAKELNLFMTLPTFSDRCGHILRRADSLVSMLNGETVELVNIDAAGQVTPPRGNQTTQE